jgi:hypothetical protein
VRPILITVLILASEMGCDNKNGPGPVGNGGSGGGASGSTITVSGTGGNAVTGGGGAVASGTSGTSNGEAGDDTAISIGGTGSTGQNSGAGGDNRSTAGGGAGGDNKFEIGDPSCGDPSIRIKFAECMAAVTRSDCETAGGTWTDITWPNMDPTFMCRCPTGQDACECDGSEDCLASECDQQPDCTSGCLVPEGTPFDDDNPFTAKGYCARSAPFYGCHDHLEHGKVTGICVD